MSTIEITTKIAALKELEDLIEEAKAEAETLRDEIKSEMLNRNTEEMEAGQYIIRWTSVLSQRFDTTVRGLLESEVEPRGFRCVRQVSGCRPRVWLSGSRR